MLGGKYIDKGNYGCVFSPELKCKGNIEKIDDVSDDLSYSKLILVEDAEDDFSIAKRISMIPLFKNYFVVSEVMCTPAKHQKEEELSKCNILEENGMSEFKLLKMPNGGTPLHRYRFDLEHFDFMRFVIHLIEAGALLNLFGILHRDLHDKNILVMEDVPRIIDFNLSVDMKQKISTDNLSDILSFRHGTHYSQVSPDYTLVNAVSKYDLKPSDVIHSIIYNNSVIRIITSILHVQQENMITRLEDFYYKNKNKRVYSNGSWCQNYWHKHDSWSIGINILLLIKRFLTWSEFSKILHNCKPILFPVLKRMCAVSPSDRIDCVQALLYLDPNSFIIRKYSTAWINKVGNGNIISS